MNTSSTSLFFLLCIFATLGYALQSTLMASVYRSLDRLSAVSYRGLSLALTMSPLLLFVPAGEFQLLPAILPLIFAASLAAALANWCAANAYSHLPVGIAAALSMTFATLCSVAIGYFFFAEALSEMQIFLIGLLSLSVLGLGATKSVGTLPAEYHVPRGIFNSLLFGIGISIGYSLVGAASRAVHPFLVGYLWESIIGVLAFCMTLFRTPRGLCSIGVRGFLKVALYSAPTVLGTGCYAYAVSIGPIGIATAVLGSMMVFSTLMSRFLYDERLSYVQWGILLAVCALLAVLRLAS
jgi:drug/metabolite transporter (DMT)-like permease